MKKIQVVIWNEFRHEKQKEKVRAIYPNGLHQTIKDFLDTDENLEIRLAALDDPDCGLPDEILNRTDVLIWWGHAAHDEVPDDLVQKICARVFQKGMGFIALHSSHFSRPFKQLIGTNGHLSWGEKEREVIWNLMPSHPIAKGIPEHFLLEDEELYAEPFYIPQPDELVFGAWYESGHIFRSGACFFRGAGKVFYFQPGHESCRSLHHPYVLKIIHNAVLWATPNEVGFDIPAGCPKIATSVFEDDR